MTPERFSELVSLACHDLRTPLATVGGFAGTLLRLGSLGEPGERYVRLMEAAAGQMGEIIDDLGVVARIEGGRFEPAVDAHDSLQLAREAAARLGEGRASVSGEGAEVAVDRGIAVRSLAALARAVLRHGTLERVHVTAAGAEVTIAPLPENAARVALSDELRDLGAAVGRAAVEALGGSLHAEREMLVVRLPRARP